MSPLILLTKKKEEIQAKKINKRANPNWALFYNEDGLKMGGGRQGLIGRRWGDQSKNRYEGPMDKDNSEGTDYRSEGGLGGGGKGGKVGQL